MKKQLLALLLALTLSTAILPAPAAALEGEANRSADTLFALGLIYGDGDDYTMSAPFTRAQAAVSLIALAGTRQSAAAAAALPSAFADTPAWAAGEINYAVQQGWLDRTDARLRPYEPITADAWFAMLLRMLGYSDKTGDFAADEAALFARHIGLAFRNYTDTLTLGDAFESMRDALTFSYKGTDTSVIRQLADRGACSPAAAAPLLDKSLTARQAADRHMAAMAQLFLYNDRMSENTESTAYNSTAFFITADGLAVTNYHSICTNPCGMATLITGEAYPVERVLYYDKGTDLAIIRIFRTSTEGKTVSAFATLELAGTDEIRSGDAVYALSNPLGLGLSVSSGIINNPASSVAGASVPYIVNSANISQGSSGGALLNEYGHVIGVTSGSYTEGNNMFLASPADPLLRADLTAEGLSLEDFFRQEQALEAEQQAAESGSNTPKS
ncbi:MAG: trypsin-like peptidase domain-containing protein [Ruminococcaceae bacterium]|nr:trypsin-like peptidase domain-containing protein [Oscillospiraceae bacterium]